MKVLCQIVRCILGIHPVFEGVRRREGEESGEKKGRGGREAEGREERSGWGRGETVKREEMRRGAAEKGALRRVEEEEVRRREAS